MKAVVPYSAFRDAEIPVREFRLIGRLTSHTVAVEVDGQFHERRACDATFLLLGSLAYLRPR